jgi:hypothetical protein
MWCVAGLYAGILRDWIVKSGLQAAKVFLGGTVKPAPCDKMATFPGKSRELAAAATCITTD